MYVTKEFTTISTDTSINWGSSVSRISPCVVEHAHCSIFLLSKTVEQCYMEERGQTTCSHSCKMTAMLSHVKLWCSFFFNFWSSGNSWSVSPMKQISIWSGLSVRISRLTKGANARAVKCCSWKYSTIWKPPPHGYSRGGGLGGSDEAALPIL